MKVIPETDRVH